MATSLDSHQPSPTSDSPFARPAVAAQPDTSASTTPRTPHHPRGPRFPYEAIDVEDLTTTRLPNRYNNDDDYPRDLEDPNQLQERLNRGFILTFAYGALLIGTISVVFAILGWKEAKSGSAKAATADQFALFQFCKNLQLQAIPLLATPPTAVQFSALGLHVDLQECHILQEKQPTFGDVSSFTKPYIFMTFKRVSRVTMYAGLISLVSAWIVILAVHVLVVGFAKPQTLLKWMENKKKAERRRRRNGL